MRQVDLGTDGMRSSALGFGCSAVMGRVGRKESLAALGAAYDAGITFYDTARSYGYGESEALLGEFFAGRRHSLVISTKFGIIPVQQNFLKNAAKPLARKVLRLLPSARKVVQRQIGAQFVQNNFTVPVLLQSVVTSLRKLRTDYIDLLFMHSPPLTAIHQEDLLAAMQQLVAEGKVRRVGISCDGEVLDAALAAPRDIRTFQFPGNAFDLDLSDRFSRFGKDFVAVANHPFGGASGVAAAKASLANLAADPRTPDSFRAKLSLVHDGPNDNLLPDLVLNAITTGTGIQVVVPSMMGLAHLKSNVAAMTQSRFSSEDLDWFRRSRVFQALA